MKKQRDYIKNTVPKKWIERKNAGLCPVCGKDKESFDKGRRVYCSVNCADKFSDHFTTWSNLREKIIDRSPKCADCGLTEENWDKRIKRKLLIQLKEINIKHKRLIESLKLKRLKEEEKYFLKQIKVIEKVDATDYWISSKLKEKYNIKVPDKWNYEAFHGFEVDHIIAVCNGGDLWDEKNLQVLCRECHKKKTKDDIKKRVITRRKEKTLINGQKQLKVEK